MKSVSLISWNINGIRSQLKKDFLPWVTRTAPDILCLQETKARPDQLPPALSHPAGYQTYWNAAERAGYSGVSTWCRVGAPLMAPLQQVSMGIGIDRFDTEGRVLQAEFPEFILFNVYFPNGGSGEERLRYKLEFYEAIVARFEALQKMGKQLIVCGDFNIAHQPIDLYDPEGLQDVSGFMPVERRWMDRLAALGFIDTYRALYPEQKQKYTWWDQRTFARRRNDGWRIDYFLVSQGLKARLKDAFIWDDVTGSDHCPVGIILQL